MVVEDFSIQHDQRCAEWQRQTSIDRGIVTIAWKMIELALQDLRRKSNSHEYRTAYIWLFNDVNYFYSFANCCNLVGFNVGEIRRRVRDYLESRQKMPRMMRHEIKTRKGKGK
jgi:hypothetical protein